MSTNTLPIPGHRSVRGPKCWLTSALAGALLGALLSFLVPAPSPTTSSAPTSAPQVIQTNPDGAKLERTPNGATQPVSSPSLSSTPPPLHPSSSSHAPPLWLILPFALLLGSIALMPFISASFWHHHYPDFAFFLGALVLAYQLLAGDAHARQDMLHAATEYYAFIALVGGLYIASGGILIDIRHHATPARNTLLLGAGCILANILGTTGASVLLIRPFMRMNKARLRPIHIVFFILTVSNCAGALTPVGDPPLYLGFLKGVPFFWTLQHMWPMWLLVNGILLIAFFITDSFQSEPSGVSRRSEIFDPQSRTPLITGWPSLLFLSLLVCAVFIDPAIKQWGGPQLAALQPFPIGATFQILMALAAYRVARPSIRHSNQFTFEPVKEVGFLFVGIFLTMAPALALLAAAAPSLALESPTQYYFLTGSLSAVLDNAPTYASFLQVALGTLHIPTSPEGIREFIDARFELKHAAGPIISFQGQALLESIALGSVFFGALTYIGNGPNFMVKSIVDAAHAQAQCKDAAPGQKLLGTPMPSFFTYLGYSLAILGPILVLNWFIFIR